MQGEEAEILELDQILNVLNNVKQFNWGDFFLFENFPENWDNPETRPYPYEIRQCDTLVRAIDNQYIYIYRPYQEIVDAIKNSYNIESYKIDILEKLDYPT